MDEKHLMHLNIKTITASKAEYFNSSGRPTNQKIIKFGPQPKSIVSQLLKKMKQDESNTIDFVNIGCKSEFSEAYGGKQIIPKQSSNIKKRKHSCLELDQKDPESKLPITTDNIHANNGIDEICPYSNEKEHKKIIKTYCDKQFACDYPECSYICKLSSNLIKHKRIHTSEKPYLCDQCSFRSNFVNSLKVHKRIHTSERPYSCTYCNYKCNSSSNLKKHCRHRHWDLIPD
ncbi:zinc finger protein 681-like isoform X2 [Achroia grisella]|uniref:zinc finger protein 681-like isoform X2 n=1 Tax=Achroia grisella TaxID=688607 RepID=UPI0027D2115E|nr:zinc finger protein 681-like isoform X2 [Achroia grisella]